jgi:hypothetical protein
MSAQPRKADDPSRCPAFLVLRNGERWRWPGATLREARDLVARAKATGELIDGRTYPAEVKDLGAHRARRSVARPA